MRHMPPLRCKGDNADGSRKDAQNDRANPVEWYTEELALLRRAEAARRDCGDLFLLKQLLEPMGARL